MEAAAQAAAEERLPTMAVSSGGGSGPGPQGLWCGCDLCPEERALQVEAAPETARQGAATTGQAREQAEAAVESIATQARGLIVFGRARQGVFEDASKLDAPQALRAVSYFVSQREFRLDISSTQLRHEAIECIQETNA